MDSNSRYWLRSRAREPQNNASPADTEFSELSDQSPESPGTPTPAPRASRQSGNRVGGTTTHPSTAAARGNRVANGARNVANAAWNLANPAPNNATTNSPMRAAGMVFPPGNNSRGQVFPAGSITSGLWARYTQPSGALFNAPFGQASHSRATGPSVLNSSDLPRYRDAGSPNPAVGQNALSPRNNNLVSTNEVDFESLIDPRLSSTASPVASRSSSGGAWTGSTEGHLPDAFNNTGQPTGVTGPDRNSSTSRAPAYILPNSLDSHSASEARSYYDHVAATRSHPQYDGLPNITAEAWNNRTYSQGAAASGAYGGSYAQGAANGASASPGRANRIAAPQGRATWDEGGSNPASTDPELSRAGAPSAMRPANQPISNPAGFVFSSSAAESASASSSPANCPVYSYPPPNTTPSTGRTLSVSRSSPEPFRCSVEGLEDPFVSRPSAPSVSNRRTGFGRSILQQTTETRIRGRIDPSSARGSVVSNRSNLLQRRLLDIETEPDADMADESRDQIDSRSTAAQNDNEEAVTELATSGSERAVVDSDSEHGGLGEADKENHPHNVDEAENLNINMNMNMNMDMDMDNHDDDAPAHGAGDPDQMHDYGYHNEMHDYMHGAVNVFSIDDDDDHDQGGDDDADEDVDEDEDGDEYYPIPHVPNVGPLDVYNPAANPIAAYWMRPQPVSMFHEPLPLFDTDPSLPFAPWRVSLLPPFRDEVANRVLIVPRRYLAAVGMLYPHATFAVARYPASANFTTRMSGLGLARATALHFPAVVHHPSLIGGAGAGAGAGAEQAEGAGDDGAYTMLQDPDQEQQGGEADEHAHVDEQPGQVGDPADHEPQYILALRRRDWPIGAVAFFPNTAHAHAFIDELKGVFDVLPGGAEVFFYLPHDVAVSRMVPGDGGGDLGVARGAGVWVCRAYEGRRGPQPDRIVSDWLRTQAGRLDQDALGRDVLVRMGEAWVEPDRWARVTRAERETRERRANRHRGQDDAE